MTSRLFSSSPTDDWLWPKLIFDILILSELRRIIIIAIATHNNYVHDEPSLLLLLLPQHSNVSVDLKQMPFSRCRTSVPPFAFKMISNSNLNGKLLIPRQSRVYLAYWHWIKLHPFVHIYPYFACNNSAIQWCPSLIQEQKNVHAWWPDFQQWHSIGSSINIGEKLQRVVNGSFAFELGEIAEIPANDRQTRHYCLPQLKESKHTDERALKILPVCNLFSHFFCASNCMPCVAGFRWCLRHISMSIEQRIYRVLVTSVRFRLFFVAIVCERAHSAIFGCQYGRVCTYFAFA